MRALLPLSAEHRELALSAQRRRRAGLARLSLTCSSASALPPCRSAIGVNTGDLPPCFAAVARRVNSGLPHGRQLDSYR